MTGVVARSAAGTAWAKRTCTTPTTSSRSAPWTTKRLWPVSTDSATRSATVPSDCSDFTAVRGTSTSPAVLPSKRIERVSSGGGVVGEGALLVGGAHQDPELGQGADVGELLRGLDPEEADRAVGRAVEEPDDRAEDQPVDAHHRRQQERGALGTGDGEALRDQLAHHHLHDGGQEDGEGERHPAHGGLPDDRLQHRLEEAGHRRLGQDADEQRGDGDAELGARQVERQVPQQPSRHAGPAAALLGGVVDLGAVDGHQRELGRDEEPIDQDEQDDGEQSERGADEERSPVGRVGRRPTRRQPRRSYRWPSVSGSTRPTIGRGGARARAAGRSRPRGARRRAPRRAGPAAITRPSASSSRWVNPSGSPRRGG